MTRTSIFAAALAGMLFAGAGANAADVNWHYNWTPDPIAGVIDSDKVGSYLTIKDEPTLARTNSTATSMNVVATSGEPASAPANFDAPFTVKLTLMDDASAESVTLTFSGRFSGTLSSGGANILTTFDVPVDDEHTFSNGNKYKVDWGQYLGINGPGTANQGGIGGFVTVTEGGGSGEEPPNETPEPSSLVLAGLGLVGLAAWRKRRQVQA